jgi:4-amino-4-deoxy-L-arabinose transferase-like glycosyltransferase
VPPTPLPERRALLALILVFAALIFFELPGSRLIEPDEARYAEIPREMLASGDFVTPRLNGANYFEKPPLLYWVNAASIAAFGHTEFAARLPTRLAALGTVAVVVVGLESAVLPGWGLWAAVILLSAPLSWVLARYNITDGILTFGMTLAFFALRSFLLRREAGRRAAGALAMLGVGVALATLAKGLIGIVLPGLVFLLWIAITGRWRRLPELLLSPAPVLFLLLTVPWFVLVQRANPDFAQIFFIREHFARYATPEASRPGPIYYFVGAFIAGFLPWTFVFWRVLRATPDMLRERARRHADELLFALWFFTILVFFSLSHSKLLPYILPAFPTAAALAARAILQGKNDFRRPLLAHAVLVTVLVAGGIAYGVISGELAHYGVTAIALAGGLLMLIGAWVAVVRAPRAGRSALLPAALAWGALYLALSLAMPRVADDLSGYSLANAAGRAGAERVVSYRCYPQIFPWELEHPIVVADYIDELGSDGVRPSALYWSHDEFWRRWSSPERLVVVVKRRALPEFQQDGAPVREIAANRRYVVLANFSTATPTTPVAAR